MSCEEFLLEAFGYITAWMAQWIYQYLGRTDRISVIVEHQIPTCLKVEETAKTSTKYVCCTSMSIHILYIQVKDFESNKLHTDL